MLTTDGSLDAIFEGTFEELIPFSVEEFTRSLGVLLEWTTLE